MVRSTDTETDYPTHDEFTRNANVLQGVPVCTTNHEPITARDKITSFANLLLVWWMWHICKIVYYSESRLANVYLSSSSYASLLRVFCDLGRISTAFRCVWRSTDSFDSFVDVLVDSNQSMRVNRYLIRTRTLGSKCDLIKKKSPH